MSKATVIDTFACQDGKAEEMEAVLTSMVETTKDEPGVEIYSYHRGEGNTFWFFALMADAESMQNHGQSGRCRRPCQRSGRWSRIRRRYRSRPPSPPSASTSDRAPGRSPNRGSDRRLQWTPLMSD